MHGVHILEMGPLFVVLSYWFIQGSLYFLIRVLVFNFSSLCIFLIDQLGQLCFVFPANTVAKFGFLAILFKGNFFFVLSKLVYTLLNH